MTDRYQIRVTLLSEAIFSSGEQDGNLVHNRALTDSYGLVYFHAKSWKGQLKRQAFWLLERYRTIDQARAQEFLQTVTVMFGLNQEEAAPFPQWIDRRFLYQPAGMRISHLELDERIRKYLIALQRPGDEKGVAPLTPHDLLEAQTHIRTGIQIEEGKAKDGRLTTYHTVKKGLAFYSELYFTVNPEPYLSDLQRIVHSLDRLGAGIHRGRGLVDAQLLVNGEQRDFINLGSQKAGESCGTLSGC